MPDLSSQSETIDLKGTCTSVAADGTASWTFTVEGVSVETTVDSGGKLKFDSKKDKECVKGLVRYAAIKGVTFTATVGADGGIKSCSLEAWPKTCDIKIDKSTTVKNSAANLFHDPTSAREWLELIFHTGPGKGKEWKRTLYFGNQEEVDMKSDGAETVSGDKCARIKLDTADQPRDAANKIPREAFKSGKVSYSTAAGCALKVDIKGGIVADKSVLGVSSQARWEIECLKRGFDAEVAKAAERAQK
ncbi:MAG: hypothetical protein AAB074_01900 [Planctomycetota bacterium]